MATSKKSGLSHDAKTIITVILLLLAYPIGVILMFVWMKWSKWIKVLVLLPAIIFILGILASVVLVATNPLGKIHTAQCAQLCETKEKNACVLSCLEEKRYSTFSATPAK